MSNRLTVLLAEAREAHQGSLRHRQSSAEYALSAGEALLEARGLVTHGAWAEWLAEAGIPDRTAQRYMLLARGDCNSAIVADLGQLECTRLARLGIRIWPEESKAFEASSSSEASQTLAIWHLGDGGSARLGVATLGDAPFSGIYRPIAQRWFLAKVLERWLGAGHAIRGIPPTEAEAVLDDWETGEPAV